MLWILVITSFLSGYHQNYLKYVILDHDVKSIDISCALKHIFIIFSNFRRLTFNLFVGKFIKFLIKSSFVESSHQSLFKITRLVHKSAPSIYVCLQTDKLYDILLFGGILSVFYLDYYGIGKCYGF